MSQTNWLCLVCVAAGATVLGCGGKTAGPKTAPAAGTVLLDDKPVEGATVVFAPRHRGELRSSRSRTPMVHSRSKLPRVQMAPLPENTR